MYSCDCLDGQIVTYYGDLYQICNCPARFNKGYVEAINEEGKIVLIDYQSSHIFNRFKQLIEEGEGDKLKWFFIPKSIIEASED